MTDGYETLELDLTDEEIVFLFKQMCRLDMRPSEYIAYLFSEVLVD